MAVIALGLRDLDLDPVTATVTSCRRKIPAPATRVADTGTPVMSWSWRESNPRPRALNQVFSGCSQ